MKFVKLKSILLFMLVSFQAQAELVLFKKNKQYIFCITNQQPMTFAYVGTAIANVYASSNNGPYVFFKDISIIDPGNNPSHCLKQANLYLETDPNNRAGLTKKYFSKPVGFPMHQITIINIK